MTAPDEVVFLVDVDNTLPDYDYMRKLRVNHGKGWHCHGQRMQQRSELHQARHTVGDRHHHCTQIGNEAHHAGEYAQYTGLLHAHRL